MRSIPGHSMHQPTCSCLALERNPLATSSSKPCSPGCPLSAPQALVLQKCWNMANMERLLKATLSASLQRQWKGHLQPNQTKPRFESVQWICRAVRYSNTNACFLVPNDQAEHTMLTEIPSLDAWRQVAFLRRISLY